MNSKVLNTADTAEHRATCNTSNSSSSSIRSRYWVFTYCNYDKNRLADLTQKLGVLGEYIFQEEIGEKGTPHLQGFLGFKNARGIGFQMEFAKAFHWEVCRSRMASIKYCSKDDTRAGEIFTNISSEIKIDDPMEGHVPHAWQTIILDLIKKPAQTKSKRASINWFWEPIGNVGKTSLAKHICMNNSDAIYVSGSGSDIKYAISMMKVKPRIVIWDIPRSSNVKCYTAIESIINGIFFNNKYESSMCIFNPPHIIVFANRAPKVPEVSADRWIVSDLSIPSSGTTG